MHLPIHDSTEAAAISGFGLTKLLSLFLFFLLLLWWRGLAVTRFVRSTK